VRARLRHLAAGGVPVVQRRLAGIINPPTVSVYFRRPTPFGGKIVFVAPGRWFGGFGLPAAAKELQRLTQPPRRS
jgi:hypothetical protein